MKILVVVPAFNEADNIPHVLRDLHGFPGDVLVVDDGSTDETAAVARACGAQVVRHPFNLGIGGTMQTGFKYAARNGYDAAIQFDGDGQHRGDQLETVIADVSAGTADLVIGGRMIPGGYRIGPLRRIGSVFFFWLIRVLAGAKIQDPTSGFRCYGRKAIALFSRSYPDDYPEVESIISAARHGLRIREVPVLMRARLSGNSSINHRKSAYYMVKVSLAMIVESMREKRVWE